MVAVETSAENEFIKRVLDVEESDTKYYSGFWALGAKRSGIGQPFYWVQTGNTIRAGFNGTVFHFDQRPLSIQH